MRKPVGTGTRLGRMVARTMSLEEASRIADTYEGQGYDVNIVENKQGMMRIYEVWVFKEKEGFFARKVSTD
jgi:hypothetical protein